MLRPPASRIITVLFYFALTYPLSLAQNNSNLIDRIQESKKAMVTVRTELKRVMPTTPPQMATFTRDSAGLIIDPSGLIVTNTHTILHAPYIFVILPDGTRLMAQVVLNKANYDFSFLRIHPPYPLTSISWADSSRVMAGDTIVGIGHSTYDAESLMSGHITKIVKNNTSLENDFLELDLDLYHGDSGGPILNAQGQLLGIVMAKHESEPNRSLAIASNKILEEYLQYKKNYAIIDHHKS